MMFVFLVVDQMDDMSEVSNNSVEGLNDINNAGFIGVDEGEGGELISISSSLSTEDGMEFERIALENTARNQIMLQEMIGLWDPAQVQVRGEFFGRLDAFRPQFHSIFPFPSILRTSPKGPLKAPS